MRREWKVSSSSSKSSMEHKLISSLNFLFKLLITCYCILIVKSDAKENDDLIALLAFKHSSIDSDPNGFLTDWSPSSSTPCYWHGVSCSGGRVAAVNLSGGGLTGRLRLDELMALPGLASLYLSRNSFSGNLSSAGAPPYCRLETLDLSSNNFSEPLSVETLFQSCDRLRVLNLSRNSVPGGTLKFGPSLAELDLSRNRISDSSLLSYSLSNCQTLNLLNFSDNKLTGNLGNSTLWSCKSLWTLDLSNNLFSGDIPMTFVTGLPESLSVFDLSHNNFTGNLFSLQFESCNNLSILNLSYNRLFGTSFPNSLTNCQLLESLDVGYNALQFKIPGVFLGNFKHLRQLSLARNGFFGEIPQELGQICGTLEVLDISGNNLTAIRAWKVQELEVN